MAQQMILSQFAPLKTRHALYAIRIGKRKPLHANLLHKAQAQVRFVCRAQAIETGLSLPQIRPIEVNAPKKALNSVVLDIEGMMCGSCAARVRSLIAADSRVESVAVNMVTEMAAVRLKTDALDSSAVAEELACRLTDCGFPSKKRDPGSNVDNYGRKWEDMAKNKEAALQRSTTKLAFAWTLVALCCGTHGAHFLHSVGVHVAHGTQFTCLPGKSSVL